MRRDPVRAQFEAVTAERRKVAEECDLLMADLTSAVAKLAALGQQTVSLARQLGKPEAARCGNAHAIPSWLAVQLHSVSPGGAAEFPDFGSPSYMAGISASEDEALSRVGA